MKIKYILPFLSLVAFVILTSCSPSNIESELSQTEQSLDTLNIPITDYPLQSANNTQDSTTIHYNALQEIILLETSISNNALNIEEDVYIKGIYQNGTILYTTDGKSLFQYQASNSKYTLSSTTPLYSDSGMIYLAITDDGHIIKGMDILVYDKKSTFPPRITNANNSTAFIQVSSQDGLEHRNYSFNQDTNKVTELDTDTMLTSILSEKERAFPSWVTPITLPNEAILYHIFLRGITADDMTSYWVLQDKEGTILSYFQTRYFDNISNVHASTESPYLVFSYSQTPGYPQLLDLDTKKVYSLFGEDSQYYHSAIDFISWVNSKTLCIGLVDFNRTITIVSIDDIIDK